MEMHENKVKCPRCGSDQLTAHKKGFSGSKAVGGAILTGGIGLLAGTIGSNKIKITCLACGKTFQPGEALKRKQEEEMLKSPVFWIILGALFVFIIMMYNACFG